MENIIIIALLSTVLVISACALIASVISIVLSRKGGKVSVDTEPLKNTLDFKIEQVEKSDERKQR